MFYSTGSQTNVRGQRLIYNFYIYSCCKWTLSAFASIYLSASKSNKKLFNSNKIATLLLLINFYVKQ